MASTVDTLVISALVLQHEKPHTGPDHCTFARTNQFACEISYDDGTGALKPLPVAVNGSSASTVLPSAPRPLRLSIAVRPTGASEKHYWPINGDILYRGDAIWQKLPTTAPEIQAGAQSVTKTGITNTAFLNVYLPRVRDVTPDVLTRLRSVPAGRTQYTPPSTWTALPAQSRFLGSTPVVGGKIQLDGPVNVDPQTRDFVVQVRGFKTPQLLAVSCPRALPMNVKSTGAGATFLQAAAMPFFIFFHAQHGQNMPTYYTNGPWPFGWDFLYFGLHHYMTYDGDAVTRWGNLGLPYQCAHAAKRAIVVVPQNKYGPHGPADEIVEFFDPDLVQEILEEIQVHIFLRSGISFARPQIGRVAAGSMSNGNVLLTSFLTQHASHSLLRDSLREVYVFDPNGDDHVLNAMPVNAALAWAKHDPEHDKRIRYYAQKPHPVHRILAGGSVPSGSFVVDASGGRFTSAVLTREAWFNAGAPASDGQLKPDWQTAHQLIPGMCVTDALRKSGF